MKVLVLLSGSGVYDGSEIHESVLTLLALDRLGAEVQCIAPNKNQLHVIDHTTGKIMEENRNVLVESARIARGNIKAIEDVNFIDYDALVITGGFGAAKNLNLWAIEGPKGAIEGNIKELIINFVNFHKPIVALCISPTVVAKALEGSGINPTLTVGTVSENSSYDIKAISDGMSSIGTNAEMKGVSEISVDYENKIITAPCYMMDASISQVADNIELAISKMVAIM